MDIEQLIQRREFLYSSLSLLFFLISLVIHASNLDYLIASVTQEGEIPFYTFTPLILCEWLKMGLVWLFCPTPSKLTGTGSLNSRAFSIPSHIHESSSSSSSRRKNPTQAQTTSLFVKIVDLGCVVWHATLCCLVCYVFIILFGAPLLSKFILTAQFSIILTSWMFTPLCLVFSPKDIIKQIVYFSTWNTKISTIYRSKLRLIFSVTGAMAGVVLIPLDWDRPWQVWPIPCLFSSFIAVTLVNFGCVIYFSYSYLESCNYFSFGKTTNPPSRSISSNYKTKNF